MQTAPLEKLYLERQPKLSEDQQYFGGVGTCMSAEQPKRLEGHVDRNVRACDFQGHSIEQLGLLI